MLLPLVLFQILCAIALASGVNSKPSYSDQCAEYVLEIVANVTANSTEGLAPLVPDILLSGNKLNDLGS